MATEWDTRVGAYGVIVKNGAVLLAHWNEGGKTGWTLPGGGLELGEDAPAAAVREIFEETGYTAQLDGLLGVDSHHVPVHERMSRTNRPLHALRIIYRAHTVAGSLVHESDGSTDEAAWIPLESVPDLHRVGLVDTALELYCQNAAKALP
ncbi:NUDIX hydrolase [Arthrobacter sp. H5]|uniref:NUDIX hydrolase n=1 Tax=Arthrobacter sp. H5 TaxID=1267973 RepID=UPI0004890EAB|nr:NUDIX hydrolase [Arthrobacter sp. H5]